MPTSRVRTEVFGKRSPRRWLRQENKPPPADCEYPLLPCDLDARRQMWSYSLRTAFFVITALAVTTGGYRWGRYHLWPIAPAVALGLFLIVWSAARGFFRFGSFATVITFYTMMFGLIVHPPIWDMAEYEKIERGMCKANLSRIWGALSYYEFRNKSLPPAFETDMTGKPLYSWRATILPHLASTSDIVRRFDFTVAWDNPLNADATQRAVSEYNCPMMWQPSPDTCYVAVVGPHTAWPGARGRKRSEIKHPNKTILVLEVDGSGINWAEPKDLTMSDRDEFNIDLNGLHPGAHALFADGHVEFLPPDIDPRKLARMLDIDPPKEPPPARIGK